ncbi:MAG TPA: GNAT family N-acetyltransferase [Flavisolibacter sp.]
MTIRQIDFDSKDYEEMLALRVSQLLEPIGVPATYIDREAERKDILVGAFDGDEMIGCCVLTPRLKGNMQLRQMAVRKDYRSKGIGAQIIDFAEAIARQRNFTTLMMHARDPVIVFYQKCGYEIYDAPFSEVGIGHHKMRKLLG